ncbi:amino acid ABC transporter substrate-binding protein [Alteromonadaceae bacterium BrNp21-10]|nr:amino acid ABC transporter substrate-binding protein [Alteromonadaceae bacterium BrNp21-10]
MEASNMVHFAIRCRLILVVLLVHWAPMAQAAIWDIVYPRPMDDQDTRDRYPLEILELALKHTGVKYQMSQSSTRMEQGRATASLLANREINVYWSMTDSKRESQLLPIRIPLYKGLIGLRLFLARSANPVNTSMVKDIAGMRNFTLVQGKDWPDTKILQANGFEVVSANFYQGLFAILQQEQADLFPRSVVEIWTEQQHDNAEFTTVVQPNLALYYPTAVYFFVNKNNVVLANLLQIGLEKAISSGDFEKLFLSVHQPLIESADLANRLVFKLDNPILPDKTPLGRPELWYHLDNLIE